LSAARELQGRSAVVTGGTRGIGLAIARALAQAGARVVVTGRDTSAAPTAVEGVQFVQADQGADADWPRVMAAVGDLPGRFDILVLNAGVSPFSPIVATTLPAFRDVMRTNLKGAFLGLKHGVAAMRGHGQGGAIAMVSSIVGKIGVAGVPAYAASKGGVRLMAKAAALELGPEKIRVNSVHPGLIRTRMTEGYDEAAMGPRAPLGRFGDPEEITSGVQFLVSDRGRFVTGTELVVDGGWIVQ